MTENNQDSTKPRNNSYSTILNRAQVAPERDRPEPSPSVPMNSESSSPQNDDSSRKQARAASVAAPEFSGPAVPLQVRVPADLVKSLKLLAIDQDMSVSEIVQHLLTSSEQVEKTWLARRRAG